MGSRNQSMGPCKLEALEPRLLLSADGMGILAEFDGPVEDTALSVEVAYAETSFVVDSEGSERSEGIFDNVEDEALPGVDASVSIEPEANDEVEQGLELHGAFSARLFNPSREILLTSGPVDLSARWPSELVTTLHAGNGPPSLESAYYQVIEKDSADLAAVSQTSVDVPADAATEGLADGIAVLGYQISQFINGEELLGDRMPILLQTGEDTGGIKLFESPTVKDLLSLPVDTNADGFTGTMYPDAFFDPSDEDEQVLDALDTNGDDRTDAVEFLTAWLFTPLVDYLNSHPATTGDIVDFLKGSGIFDNGLDRHLTDFRTSFFDPSGPEVHFNIVDINTGDTTEDPDAELTFVLRFELSVSQDMPIDLGLDADAFRMFPFTGTWENAGQVKVPVTTTLGFRFEFGIHTGGQTSDDVIDAEDFFIRWADPLTVSAQSNVSPLDFHMHVGFLGTEVTGGSLNFNATVETDLIDANDPDLLGFTDAQFGLEKTAGYVTGNSAIPSWNLEHDVGFFLRLGNLGESTPVLVPAGDYVNKAGLQAAINLALADADIDHLVFAVIDGVNHLSFGLWPTLTTNPLGMGNETISSAVLPLNAISGNATFEYSSNVTFLLSENGEVPGVVSLRFADPSETDIGFSEGLTASLVDDLEADLIANSNEFGGDALFTLRVRFDDGTSHQAQVNVTKVSTGDNLGDTDKLVVDLQDALDAALFTNITAGQSGGYLYISGDSSVAGITLLSIDSTYAESGLGFIGPKAVTVQLTGGTVGDTDFDDGDAYTDDTAVFHMRTNLGTFATYVISAAEGRDLLGLIAAINTAISGTGVEAVESSGQVRLKATSDSVWDIQVRVKNQDMDDMVADLQRALNYAGLSGVNALNSGGTIWLQGGAPDDVLEISGTLTFDAGITYSELLVPAAELFEASKGGSSNVQILLPVTVNAGLDDATTGPPDNFQVTDARLVANFDPFNSDKAEYDDVERRFRLIFTYDPNPGLPDQDSPASSVPGPGGISNEIRLVNFGELLNFSILNAESMIGLISSLGTALQQLSQTEVFRDYQIPFADATLSQFFNYADGDGERYGGLIDMLVFDVGVDGLEGPDGTNRLMKLTTIDGTKTLVTTFFTAQSLADRLDFLLGPGLVQAAYHSGNNELTYQLVLEGYGRNIVTDNDRNEDTADGLVPFEFNVPLDPFSKLAPDSAAAAADVSVTISGRTGLAMTMGVDLSPPGFAIFDTTSFDELNGEDGLDFMEVKAVTFPREFDVPRIVPLGGAEREYLYPFLLDVAFSVEVNAGPEVEIVLPGFQKYWSIEDLVNQVNDAIADAGLDAVLVADYDSTTPPDGSLYDTSRIVIAALDPSTDFTIKVNNEYSQQQLGYPVVYPAEVSDVAIKADFIIQTRDGVEHLVSIDDVPGPTMADLIGYLNTIAPFSFEAAYNFLHSGLRLKDITGGTEAFQISTINGSEALLGLGLFLTEPDLLPPPAETELVGNPNVIEGGNIGLTSLDGRFFVRDAEMQLGLSMATVNPGTGVPGSGLYGIVGVDVHVDGSLTAEISADLADPGGPKNQITLEELMKQDFTLYPATVEKLLKLDYDNELGPTDFTPGDVLIGADPGDIAVIATVVASGSTGYLLLSNVTGTFSDDDVIVAPDTGTVAQVNGIPEPEGNFGSFNLVVQVQEGFDDLAFDSDFKALDDAPYTVPFVLVDFGNPYVPTEPSTGGLVLNSLGDLRFLDDYDYDSVRRLVNGLLNVVLDVNTSFTELNKLLPAINRSVGQLLDLTGAFERGAANIEEVLAAAEFAIGPEGFELGLPALRLQDLPQALRGAFGLPDGVDPYGGGGPVNYVKLDYDTGSTELLLSMNLFNEVSTKLGLDIVTGPTSPNLTSAGVLEVYGALAVHLETATDLNSPSQIYLLDSSYIGGGIDVIGEGQEYDIPGGQKGLGLVFRSNVGPLSVFIKDGDVLISFVFILPGLDFGGSGRQLLDTVAYGDWIAPLILADDIEIVLPMFYGGEGPNDFIGEYAASGGIAGLTVTEPDYGDIVDDITEEVVPYDPFENILLAIDTLDLYLELLSDELAGEVLGIDLPFIGDQMADILFIEDFRRALTRTIKNGVENAVDPDPDTIIQSLITAAFTGPLSAYLISGPVQTNNLGPAVPPEDRYREWTFTVGRTDTQAQILTFDDFDIGPDHLLFDMEAPLTVTFDWSIEITFGVDFGNGAYIDVSDADDVDLDLKIELPGTGPFDGELGFLKLDVTDPGGNSGADLVFAVDVKNGTTGEARLGFADIGSLNPEATLTGNRLDGATYAANLHLITKTVSILPVMTSDFIFDWALPTTDVDDLEGDAVTPGIQLIKLDGMEFDALYAVQEALGQPLQKIAEFIEPFMPVIDILTAEIPILSDLAGEPFTLIDLAGLLSDDVDTRFIEAVADILKLIGEIGQLGSLPTLILGDLTLFDIGTPGSNYFNPDPLTGDPLGAEALLLTTPGLNIDSQFSTLISGSSFLTDLGTGNLVDGLTMPIFDPSLGALEIIKMFVNQDATIVEYELPPLSVGFEYLQVFPVWGPLAVSIEINFSFTLDLHSVGFDTYGIRRWAQTDFRNGALILDGFFFSDGETDTSDDPEIIFQFGLVGAAELNLIIARGGVGGGVNALITFDWNDSVADGHVHISEIYGNIEMDGLLGAFDVGGKLTFELFAFLEVSLLGIEEEFPITPEITLLDFGVDFERLPRLGTEEGGVLYLNMGPNAQDRLNGDTSDGNEDFTVTYVSDGKVKVSSSNLGVTSGQEYEGVHEIIAYGGEGNDTITFKNFDADTSDGGSQITGYVFGGVGDDTIVFDGTTASSDTEGFIIIGGLGNDTLKGGPANDVIYGNEGNDTVWGNGGYDILFGDDGRFATTYISSRIQETDGADNMDGGKGDDVVIGAGGSDILRGGDGIDLILGDGGRFAYTMSGEHVDVAGLLPAAYVPVPISSYVEPAIISAGIDAVEDAVLDRIRAANLGLGGNDEIHGDGGNDLVLGGTGDDTIEGNGGDDILLGGKGFDKISGGANNDSIYGGDQADVLYGNDGDDVMAGGSGNDFMHGDGDNDVMKGDTGADVMFGDAGDDQVFGQTEPDLLFGGVDDDLVVGGSSNDIMFGDDGLIAKLATDLDPTVVSIGIGNAALLVGQFHDQDIRTLDLIITDVVNGDGDDILSGDAGDDIMLGGGGNDLFGGDVDPRLPVANTPAPEDVTPISEDVIIGDGGKVTFNERRFRSIETIIGAVDVDANVDGHPFDDIIYGDNGQDYILGGRGSDYLFGGHGKVVDITEPNFEDALGAFRGPTDPEASDNDIIVGDNGELLFADDTHEPNFGHLEMVRTTDEDDVTGGHEYVEGELDNDVIFGGVNGSVDVLFGSDGQDIILGDNGEIDFSLDEALGAGIPDLNTIDLIRSYRDGLGGEDWISGDQGDDVLIGGTAGDLMYGDDATASHGSLDGEDIMLGDNGKVELINDPSYDFDSPDAYLNDITNFGRLYVQVAASEYPTTVDLIATIDDIDEGDPDFDELSEVEAIGGPDTMSGNAKADIMLGGVNNGGTDFMYGDRVVPDSTTIADDADDIMLGDNGLLDFTYAADTDRTTLDLIQSFEDGLGGTDDMSGNKGEDVAIGGTGDDTIYGDDDDASAASADMDDILIGDNADIFLVAVGSASGGDLKVVLDAAVKTIVTTDEDDDDPLDTGGVDTISGNAGGDIIAGGVEGDYLYGDRASPTASTTADDGDDIILGDNGSWEWLSTGRLDEIYGIDIDANNPELFAKFDPAEADTDLTTLDLVTTEQPRNGGRDWIYGDEGSDLIFGGTDLDTIYGDDADEVDFFAVATLNNDVMFGDHGRLYPQYARWYEDPADTALVPALVDGHVFHARNYFAIHTAEADAGEGDVMHGEEGDDIMLGQQGDDRMWGGSDDDDMTGGHNVSGDQGIGGGYDELGETNAGIPEVTVSLNPSNGDLKMNDLMDGGTGNDSMAGDNTIIWRRGDVANPRFRDLTGDQLYTTGPDTITTNITSDKQLDPDQSTGRDVQLVDHDDGIEAIANGRYGQDVMAGGPGADIMYGQLGDDLMQGDGAIESIQNVGVDEEGDPFVSHELEVVDDTTKTPDTDETLYFNIPEAVTDGDDYMEGNGGNDLMYGGLGQDDMIGGSSALFGLDSVNAALLTLTAEQMRPDGSDIIFGGAGVDIDYNDIGDATWYDDIATTYDEQVILTDPTGHANDADFIMGDNANVYRIVETNADPQAPDVFRTYNYDESFTTDEGSEDRGEIRIIPRAMEQLDYTLGGADYATLGQDYTPSGAAIIDGVADNGLADIIHGEAGDDYIFGMTGSDAIYGEGQDDDIVGGYGNDWIAGGTGQDGVVGDDGLLLTSRNSVEGEPLYGIAGLLDRDASPRYSNGDALGELIYTPGEIQIARIHLEGALKKTADLVPFSYEYGWMAMDDEFHDDDTNTPYADDIIFGGLGSDFLHGGSGDDAMSGAGALPDAYVPTFDLDGNPDGVLNLGYNVFQLPNPINPGDTVSLAVLEAGNVLAFNPVDQDGQHLNNRFRAGEFFLYDEYDPRRKILLDPATGELYKLDDGGGVEFLLNFDESAASLGVTRPAGEVPKPTGQQVESYPQVYDDGKDAIFGDNGNDWIVGGTGRDNIYGGWGNDLLNADDKHDINDDGTKVNTVPDTHPTYEDRAYGGAGRDVLIGNTGGDRLIDWVGEYNSYLVPYAPFGQASVSRTLQPFLPEFLYALSAADGADPTRYVDAIGAIIPEPTKNNPNPSRNGEPHGELGMVLQKDFAWQDQTGAPADPQAGNIPGGPRDVLRSAGFNDGSSDGFFADSGVWSVEKGAYLVEPEFRGGDALSVYHVDEYIPNYFEMLASLNPVKPIKGYKSNAYIVFDYQSDTDFKFAGINVSNSKLEIGHRTETEWIVDVQAVYPGSLKAGTNYNVFLALNGSTVTLTVDNKVSLSHVFELRIDAFGIAHGLKDGMVGLGANNSKAMIDNVIVQRLRPPVTFTLTETFEAVSSGLFAEPISGSWVTENGFVTASLGGDVAAIDLIQLDVSPASLIRLAATLTANGEGGFVFDQYGLEDYKFVVVSSDSGEVLIGHRTAKGFFVDAAFADRDLRKGAQDIEVTLKGSTVSVMWNEQLILGHAFNALVTDGSFGILANHGQVAFDEVTFQTDDFAYASEASPAPIDESVSQPVTVLDDLVAPDSESHSSDSNVQPAIHHPAEFYTISAHTVELQTTDPQPVVVGNFWPPQLSSAVTSFAPPLNFINRDYSVMSLVEFKPLNPVSDTVDADNLYSLY
ncbi:MAG: LEPR-XLL domain-containing protein [Puniceicoccaceae bacterium]